MKQSEYSLPIHLHAPITISCQKQPSTNSVEYIRLAMSCQELHAAHKDA